MLLNNVCETFNACILDAREKPILTMLEWIREYLMRRMQENRDRCAAKWKKPLCPKIQKILQKQLNLISDCIPIKADDQHYQVSCFDGSQHSVDLGSKSCSCRKWQLSIYYQKQDPVDYVHECYHVETYKKVYAPAILPMTHEGLWSESCIIPPIPQTLEKGQAGHEIGQTHKGQHETVKKRKALKRNATELAIEALEHANEPAIEALEHVSEPAVEVHQATEPVTNVEAQSANILPPLQVQTEDEQPEACLTQDQMQPQAASPPPEYMPGPSMFHQLQMTNSLSTLQRRVTIRAPPPFRGRQILP
ncbi:UNVERIFIED_CONTAM: hypothetical protein Sradi_3369400 [Sesamum radiatum]|uniref:Uncharacterized protein n=1 Tax=Sesamum radiatum TaxID=300843 RepID=A0AAW2R342_SESRA